MHEYYYEGRSLREWLLQLVDDSPNARQEASAVITDRFYLPIEKIINEGADFNKMSARFQNAVRETLRDPVFPAADYVQKLFSLTLSLEEQRLAEWREQQRADREWHDAQTAKLVASRARAEFRRSLKRAGIRVRRELKELSKPPHVESSLTLVTLNVIIDSLGPELLPAAALIRFMLTETHQANIASEAIARMGRAGLEFWPTLVAGLEKRNTNSDFTRPVGLLLRNEPERISEILELTRSSNPNLRYNAMTALGFTGRDPMRDYPEVETRLRELLANADGNEWFACVSSLGEIAVSLETVTALLAATHDPARVGPAIDSLGRIALDPDRVIPRLIELLSEFKEYDSDCSMYGECFRVVSALESFGDKAAAALPELIKRIWTPFNIPGRPLLPMEPDQSIIKLLGKLGPLARAALPQLLAAKEELIRRGVKEYKPSEPEDTPLDPESFCPEYLSEAIANIERAE